MPDLDNLLDTLVADVAAGTRAPGAPEAIKQARRRRTKLAVVGAVAVVAVGGGLAAGTLGGGDEPSVVGEPSPSASTQEPATPSPTSIYDLSARLDAIFVGVPGWAITDVPPFPDDYDYAFNGPCAGDWGRTSISGGDGGFASAGYGGHGYPSKAQASTALARFISNLESCVVTEWRTQPIAQTEAVLASSPTGVAWIRRQGDEVWVLQVPTTDGPPPEDVQVEVVEWMDAYKVWQAEQNN
jgi:hypothetical protein